MKPRRSIFVTWLLLATLLAPGAHAQTSTAAGIDAFLRGDYGTAVATLKPITDHWPGPIDEAAAFFMAGLYANGLGVPRDVVRACALLVRAPSSTTPFGRMKQTTVNALLPSLTEDQLGDCLFLSSLGFDHRFVPTTFSLETAQSIAFELSGREQGVMANIRYQGLETRSNVAVPTSAGVVFLPIEHTELVAGRPISERRHFIQMFTWMPNETRSSWQLMWSVFEVVRDRLEQVTGVDLVTVAAGVPPTAPEFDVHDYATVRVNAAGHAEWAILKGPHAEHRAIETETERLEVRAQQMAREKADAAVDWKRTRDMNRPPDFRYADAEGCGQTFSYAWSADRMEAIAIRADAKALQLSTTPQTFDLFKSGEGLDITAHLFEHPRRKWPFCTDNYVNEGDRHDIWRVVGGLITLQLSEQGVRASQPNSARLTIQIVGAEFVSPTGQRIRMPQAITISTIVGGFYG